MKKSLQIFKRDLDRLRKNPAAVIVAVGLCVIPALYAWFNIAANQDPYSNTSGIRVAVANKDKGAENENRALNAGEEILNRLADNDDLGWVFTDEEEALEGVKSGAYYAAIVIPEDLSEALLEIEDGAVSTPSIQYYVNEKKNAVAPKITDSGASAIQEEINQSFSEEASKAIAEELQDFGLEIGDELEMANDNILSMLSDTRDNFAAYQQALADFQAAISQGSAQIDHAKTTLDEAVKAADAGSGAFSDASELLGSSRKNVRSFGALFDQSLSDGETFLNNIYTDASLKLGNLETSAGQAQKLIQAGQQYGETLSADSQTAISTLEALIAQYQPGTDTADQGVAALETLKTSLETLKAQNDTLNSTLSSLNTAGGKVTELLTGMSTAKTQMDALLGQGTATLRNFRTNLNGSLIPNLGSSLDTVSDVSGDLKAALRDVSTTASQLKGVLDQLDTSLTEGAKALEETGSSLSLLDERLSGMQKDLETLRASKAYQDILDLREVDAQAVSDFMASPVLLDTTTFYEVDNYGSSMAPFYTNLALWVGGMVLIAILKQEVDEDERVHGFTSREAYFGRELIFILLAAVQTLIVCLGDLWLLRIQCLHPALFVLAGLLASFVYLNLIYAVTAAFQHIGRAIFVFLVIIQIPGSTGTYPVEMMGGFYRAISPFLPFTYSNAAMRETIGGMYGGTYLKNMGILAVFLLAALFSGLCVRPALLNLNELFDRRLGEADFILCEENAVKKEQYSPALIAAALRKDAAAREENRLRAEEFERHYRARRRAGFLAMLIVPAIFLLLMFSMESKLVFLALWIAVLIGISIWLIRLEYRHENTRKQLYLDRLSEEELLRAVKEERRA